MAQVSGYVIDRPCPKCGVEAKQECHSLSLDGFKLPMTTFHIERYALRAPVEERTYGSDESYKSGSSPAMDLLGRTVDSTLSERGKRYGAFYAHAIITQALKDTMADSLKWPTLSPAKKEALEMIVHKIGRILNGDPSYRDSWTDIAGYALLIERDDRETNPNGRA